MRKFLFLLIASITFLHVSGQIHDPVKWSFDSERINSNEFELKFKAKLDKGWHLYSQNLPSEDGPIATSFVFDESSAVQRIGVVEEPKAKTEYDPNFDMELAYFEKYVEFVQRVKISANTKYKGELTYMVCDEKMCLPPEYVPYSFKLSVENVASEAMSETEEAETEEVEKESSSAEQNSFEQNQILDPLKWEFSSVWLGKNEYLLKLCAKIDKGWHLYSQNIAEGGPLPTVFNFKESPDYELVGKTEEVGELEEAYDPNFLMDLSWYNNEVEFQQKVKSEKTGVVEGSLEFMTCDDRRCLPPEIVEFSIQLSDKQEDLVVREGNESDKLRAKGFVGIFIAGFLGGLLALLTPCVFPMIPLTVSFFTKQSKSKAQGLSNAILYGIFIILIYVGLGFMTTWIFGPDALNEISTGFWFNLIFFIMFVVFAISFFGAFEITLPASWVNKADQASDKGGFIGIFFMAFTLSLVSFSCTGPIIGTLLVEAAVNGGVAGPLLGMFGFSLALAMPFALFAAFPGWLNSLPRSGGWLNSVKVVLGFLELALALKFLSNADLVVQAGILTRELFIAIWIGIFGMMTAYLLGAFRLPHDSPMDRLSVGRMLFGTLTLIFTLYLIPGLWGAPLKLISGFPPPMFYSESPHGVGMGGVVAASMGSEKSGHSKSAHCPHNLNCFHDYDEALAYAKEVNKPLMVDFTGWACVNCRKMEEQVWSDPSVLNRLSENVVLVSLYVDEKLELPESEQKEVKIGEKTKILKTVGNKWSYFQASKFGTNSQPYYVILDHEGNALHESAAYDPDIPKFVDWLDRGTKLFSSK